MKFKTEKEWLEMHLITKKCRLSRIEYFVSKNFVIEYYEENEPELQCKLISVDRIKSWIGFEKTMNEKYSFIAEIDELEKREAKEILDKQKEELTLF